MSKSLRVVFALLVTSALHVACGFAADAGGPVLAPPIEDSTHPEPKRGSAAVAPPRSKSWANLLRDLADDTIPRDYEARDGWGNQTEIVTGVRIREKNGLPRISKRTKRVNHGDWRRYRVALLNPSEKLRFAIHDVHAAERGGMTLTVVVSARVRCTARSEFWSYGLRAGSVTVQADATVRVVARFVVRGREVDPHDDGWFVEVEYTPDVDRVRIELDDVDVCRIGHLDGDLADGLGNSAQFLLSEVLHRQEEKVTKCIRRELADPDSRIKVTLPRAMFGASDPDA